MMVRVHRSFRIRRIVPTIQAAIFALATAAASEAAAQKAVQDVPNAMQGFSQNRDQPIKIEAASLELRDKKKQATFSGNVKVMQGDTTMTSKTLVAFYEKNAAPSASANSIGTKSAPLKSETPGPGGSSSIRRLEAKGGVVVTQKDQIVSGEAAVFDTRTNRIAMLGGVVLTQCKSVMRGDRLTVDMSTGVSRIESDSGKVQVLLIQRENCGSSILAAPAANKPK
jgi:lipopolysaccharide export system protein LptA